MKSTNPNREVSRPWISMAFEQPEVGADVSLTDGTYTIQSASLQSNGTWICGPGVINKPTHWRNVETPPSAR